MNGNDDRENGGNRPPAEPFRRPRMSRENRAKQFAPFAALTGLEAALLAKELEAAAAAEPERGEAIEIP